MDFQERTLTSPAAQSMRKLVEEFKKLPGISLKAAQKLSYSVLCEPKFKEILKNIIEISENVEICDKCGTFKPASENCANCADDSDIICVVATYGDMSAIERNGCFKGSFHILGGLIEPLEHILPENLRIAELKERVLANPGKEILLALPFSIEGDATTLYIKDSLENCDVKLSRIARGLPAGAAPDVLDRRTVLEAFNGKTYIN